MGGVIKGATFHVEILGLLKERHQSVCGSIDPRLRQSVVVERKNEKFKDVTGSTKLCKHVG
jgi:hypothetical protein